MGLKDESWCADCGKSQPYSENDVVCADCTADAYDQRSIQLINYMRLHLLSLTQDLIQIEDKMEAEVDLNSDTYNELDIESVSINGQIFATRHLMSVATDILAILTEEN
jgi:hypothetical protein